MAVTNARGLLWIRVHIISPKNKLEDATRFECRYFPGENMLVLVQIQSFQRLFVALWFVAGLGFVAI